MKFRSIVVMVLFVIATAAAGEKMVLTLEKSVDLALENNPDFQIAQRELVKARAAVTEAYSAVLPSLQGSVNFQHAWEIQQSTIPNFLKFMLGPAADLVPELKQMPDFVQISFGLENTFTYGLVLQQPLFLGGAGLAGIKIASAARRAAEHNMEMTKQELIYRSTQAFYSCLLAEELVEVQAQALEQAEANLEIVQKKYRAGSASGFDRMRAEVEAANLRPSLISARNGLKLALTNLRNILGFSETVDLELQGSLFYVDDEFAERGLNELRALAMEGRPEIAALEQQKTIARKSVALARSSFLPKVYFQTDYSFLAMRNDYNFQRDDFSKGFSSAISLQIPLFQGFRNAKQYQKAQVDVRIMVDTEKKIRDGISAEVEMAFHNFSEAREKYLSAAESVELAEEALRLANLTYEEGASTQLDVLNSNLALTRARMNTASSIFEYQMARYELRKVTGVLTGIL